MIDDEVVCRTVGGRMGYPCSVRRKGANCEEEKKG